MIGVRRSFLLAASSVGALKQLTPFVTRTLPARTLPKEDVSIVLPQEAMRGSLRESLKSLLATTYARRKTVLEKAKANAAAEPKGVPAGARDAISEYVARQNERMVDWLADAGDAHLTLSANNGAFSLRGDLAIPQADSALGKQVNAWTTGDAAGALAFPASAVLAFTGTSGMLGKDSATDFANLLASTWPDEIGDAEKLKIEGVFNAWSKVRGDGTSGAFLYQSPTTMGLVIRLAAKDSVALGKLLKDTMTSTLAVKGVANGLVKAGVSAPVFTSEKVSGLDADVMSVKLPARPGEKTKASAPEALEVIWAAHGGEVALAIGVGSRALFAALVESKAADSLAGSVQLATQMKALGGSLAGAAIMLPSRFIPIASGAVITTPAPPNDPVSIAIGKTPAGLFFTADLSRPALELASRFATGGLPGAAKSSPF
ncbi:MAG: hypothetical protein NVS3B20_14170 [Polyangiales bacterium]